VGRWWLKYLWWTVAFVCAACLALGAVGCGEARSTETDSFEAAERLYRRADYRRALALYQKFLDHYPNSPLADTARLRIRCIHREVSTMLDRHDMPRPVYHATEERGQTLPRATQPERPGTSPGHHD
jgi:hypothetical protein